MEPFRTLRSRTVVMARQNIDTDQIIPARFLKITHRAGLGRWLFADWRYQPDGSPHPDFILEQPEAQGARVLVAGDNFGCGSSREHAPWALVDWGFRAVISSSIADIFSNNAIKNGLLPIRVDAGFHRRLLAEPGSEVIIDLEHRTVRLADGTEATFPLDPFARYCLMNGVDELGFLLGQEEAIARFEEARS
ncbi:3-isopropylmalate dehydratase small subunit [Vitiosangium sp. GDMCC 1.1324]|uniref:3-isopropylmalate dehydratase small subunit n=1 Tax=Vitiosangium sp. (strain GDMCC 1.1324) TaxID=2138576 RepID=UPI000D3531EA|nr:3-isopropylmalate dehydratase small subunit [Vitiosangium sp. GDMCC 1.1324]PTL76280.1 3-isopropylmalate dehydratase small subunit [Vitiosangium sp. GDMCC 1.1324]